MADVDTIKAIQLKKVQSLVLRASYENEFYRRLFADAGVAAAEISSLEEFAARVPTISKPDFVADQATDPPFGRRFAHARELGVPLFVNTTSGTSGQGQEIHMQTGPELQVTGEVYSYWFRWAGLEPGNQLFLTLPITMFAGGVLEYHGAVCYGLTVHSVGNYEASRKVTLMRRFEPEAVLANTSYMGRLESLLGSEPLWPQLKCLLTGAEGAGIVFLQRLAEAWGVPVFDRYGSAQAGNDHLFTCEMGIGDPSRPGMMHNIDPYVLLEVVDPDTGRHVNEGEEGELIITSLYRTDTPLIRCRIGDWAVYHGPDYCTCGRPFMGVETASIFRRDDVKKIKGVGVWPQAVNDAIFAAADVAEYQVTLTSEQGADIATVGVMSKLPLQGEELVHLQRRVADNLRDKTGINFEIIILQPGALDVGELKAKRWIDQRAHTV
jgi:phenylacetate-CoA ligase